MTRIPEHEHHHLLVLVEHLQRDGRPEREIHEAVREATSGRTHPPRSRPSRGRGGLGCSGAVDARTAEPVSGGLAGGSHDAPQAA